MMEEKPISDILQEIFRRYEMTDAVDANDVKRVYAEVVGDLVSKLTRSLRYDNHTLYVKVSSAALARELFCRRSGLADKINDVLQRRVVERVVIEG